MSAARSGARPLRILVYGINFTPEPVGIGKYTGEMCAWLAQRGHAVRVITTCPWFPDWRLAPEHRAWRQRREQWLGVDVVRVPHWVPKRPAGLRRVLHGLGFALASLPALVQALWWRPDIVWTVAPSLASAPGALLCAAVGGVPCWLHIQDFEVDAAFELGMLRGKMLRALARGLERYLLHRFDRVSSISERMCERLHDKGVDGARALLFPNWVDISAIQPLCAPSAYRVRLGIPADAPVALYSGSMGAKQGLELMAEAVRVLQSAPSDGGVPVHFVFCGQGAGRAALEQACSGLARVHWLPLQPPEELGALLGMADIHLLPQRADAADLVLPSKLTGMLASGRPVIATAHPGTTLARIVAECGVVVTPEDPGALATALGTLASNAALRSKLGAAARRIAEERLAQDAILSVLETELRSLCPQGPGNMRHAI